MRSRFIGHIYRLPTLAGRPLVYVPPPQPQQPRPVGSAAAAAVAVGNGAAAAAAQDQPQAPPASGRTRGSGSAAARLEDRFNSVALAVEEEEQEQEEENVEAATATVGVTGAVPAALKQERRGARCGQAVSGRPRRRRRAAVSSDSSSSSDNDNGREPGQGRQGGPTADGEWAGDDEEEEVGPTPGCELVGGRHRSCLASPRAALAGAGAGAGDGVVALFQHEALDGGGGTGGAGWLSA